MQQQHQQPQQQRNTAVSVSPSHAPPQTPPVPLAPRQVPKSGRGKKGSRPVNRDRFISKMFLRGDSVILVLRNPK
jgi:hypothetical protein